MTFKRLWTWYKENARSIFSFGFTRVSGIAKLIPFLLLILSPIPVPIGALFKTFFDWYMRKPNDEKCSETLAELPHMGPQEMDVLVKDIIGADYFSESSQTLR